MTFSGNRTSEFLARSLVDDIHYQRNNYFFFLGKVTPWGTGGDETFNNIVPDSAEKEREARDTMVFTKKVNPSNACLMTRRIDWSAGTVYTKWDHTRVMKGTDFYVVTPDLNVYKCLDNFGDAPSTVMPRNRNILPRRETDGYIWKFMYTIPGIKERNFLIPAYIPVQRASENIFFEDGAIRAVNVINGGTGFADTNMVNVVISGPTVGAGASVSFVLDAGGSFASVSVLSAGSGYTHGAQIRITSASGTGAILRPIFTAGILTSVVIDSPGANYFATDTVTVITGGATAYAVFDHSNGSVREIKLLNRGAGYAVPPTAVLNSLVAGQPGTGMFAPNTGAVLQTRVANGSIRHVQIVDPGLNYPIGIQTGIRIDGNGRNAVLHPIVINGSIVEVTVLEPGENYSAALLSPIGTGTGARLEAVFSITDIDNTEQSIVERWAPETYGHIYSVEVSVPGVNYSPETYAIIQGDGTGASARVVLDPATRGIRRIDMIEFGSSYSRATVEIIDPNVLGSGAQAYVIFPPNNGHGYDATQELFADVVSVSSKSQGAGELIALGQDFRIAGLIRNPLSFQTKQRITAQENMLMFRVLMTSTSGMVRDELLSFNERYHFLVLSFSNNIVDLLPITKRAPTPIGRIESLTAPGRQYTISEILSSPLIDKYTGDLLSIVHGPPFRLSEVQGINIRTLIEF